MTIYQLELFLALTEGKGFSSVAEQLYIVQSTLSKQIKALEKELDTRLFTRKNKGVELTASGQVFLTYAQRILAEYQAMKKELYPFTSLRKKPIIVCGEPGLAPYGIHDLIDKFNDCHDDLDVQFHERAFSEVLHLLDRREADMALVWEENVNIHGYDVQRIIEDEMVLIISSEHPLAKRGGTIDLLEVKNEPFSILFRSVCRPLTLKLCQNAGFYPHTLYEVLRTSSQFDLAAMGKAVGIVGSERALKWGNPNVAVLRIRGTVRLHLLTVLIKRDISPETKELRRYLCKNLGVMEFTYAKAL